MEQHHSGARENGKAIIQSEDYNAYVYNNWNDAGTTIEFESVVKATFPTQDAFYDFYNMYAKAHGFSIRKDKIKTNSKKEVYYRRYLCSREGVRDPKYNNIEHRLKTERAISRCECPAKLVIKYHPVARMWYVAQFEDEHSHPLASSTEVPFLRSHRKIGDTDKKDIETMLDARVRKIKIMDLKERENNGHENIGFTSKDLYNHCHRERKKKIDVGDAQTVLNSFKARRKKDRGFFYCYEKDDEGRLSHLFWADERSRIDYMYFGDVLIFDSTFRTNRYRMPFVPFLGVNNHRRTIFFGCGLVAHETTEDYKWLLTAFLLSGYQKHPNSVVTDGDFAMRNAIVEIFPNSTHRLCCWHIKRNVPKNIRTIQQRNAFKRLMFRAMTPHEFDEGWKNYIEAVGGGHDWSKHMYETRQLWAETFFKGKKFWGIRSSQRSESANALLQRYLERNMLIQDLLCHYEICVARTRSNEARDDCKATQTRPSLRSDAHPLEICAARTYTPNNFIMFQLNLLDAHRYQISSPDVSVGYIEYMLLDQSKGADFEIVCIKLNNTDPVITCTCMNMEAKGIPCSHIIAILVERNFKDIPGTLIWDRWTINCKFCLPPNEFGQYEVDDFTRKYQDLVSQGKKLFLQVAKDDEAYVDVKNWLSSSLKKKSQHFPAEIYKGEEQANEVAEAEAGEHSDNVLAPSTSKCKGAPKTRFKAWYERRPHRCINCRREDHDARTCPFSDGLDSEEDY